MSSWEERQSAKPQSTIAAVEYEPFHEHKWEELRAWGSNWTDARCECGDVIHCVYSIVIDEAHDVWADRMDALGWPLELCPSWMVGGTHEGDGTSTDE